MIIVVNNIKVDVHEDPDYPTLIWANYDLPEGNADEAAIHEEIAAQIGFLKPIYHNDFGFWQMYSQKYAGKAYRLADDAAL